MLICLFVTLEKLFLKCSLWHPQCSMEKYPYSYQFEKKFSTVIQWRLRESKVVKSSEKENFLGLFECLKTNISVKYAFFLGMFTTYRVDSKGKWHWRCSFRKCFLVQSTKFDCLYTHKIIIIILGILTSIFFKKIW